MDVQVEIDFVKVKATTVNLNSIENGLLWDTTSVGSNGLLTEDGLPKESVSEVGKMTHGATSSSMVNQQVQKRANSPRLPQSITSKRSKEE